MKRRGKVSKMLMLLGLLHDTLFLRRFRDENMWANMLKGKENYQSPIEKGWTGVRTSVGFRFQRLTT